MNSRSARIARKYPLMVVAASAYSRKATVAKRDAISFFTPWLNTGSVSVPLAIQEHSKLVLPAKVINSEVKRAHERADKVLIDTGVRVRLTRRFNSGQDAGGYFGVAYRKAGEAQNGIEGSQTVGRILQPCEVHIHGCQPHPRRG